MKFPLAWLLLNRWLWVIIIGSSVIAVGPFLVLTLLLSLPSPELKGAATLMLFGGSGVAAGYKDWVISKRNEDRK